MDSKSAIFIAVGTLLVMAMYSSITNFVSAATTVECFGGSSVDHYICVTTRDDGTIKVQDCIRNKEGISECTTLNPKPTPPGIEQSTQNTVKEDTQTNTNDSKDLGGMQTDKGITKSPIN
jgi:hypothetical protein